MHNDLQVRCKSLNLCVSNIEYPTHNYKLDYKLLSLFFLLLNLAGSHH